LRIGIDHPGNAKLVSDYVLRKAPLAEQQLIEESIHNSLRTLPDAVAGDWNKAMKDLHTQ
jgi:PTH1 family peptidyl-tRNA hydrolase